MTTGSATSKSPRRHSGATRHIGNVLPAVTRAAFRSAGPAAAQLIADWPLIVGPALAAVSVPRRFTAGTLTLGCSGPVAMELQHLSTQLIQRVNGHLGRPQVLRIRIVQDAPQQPQEPGRQPVPQPGPVTLRVIDGLPDGPLRDALARLGGTLDREPA